MQTRSGFIVLFGAVILGICNAIPLNSNEEEARKFAQNASETIFAFHDKLVNDEMKVDPENLSDLVNALDTLLDKANIVGGVVRGAMQFDDTKFKDEELRYIMKQLKKSAGESILGTDRFLSFVAAKSVLEQLAGDKDIEGYKDKNVSLSYFPDIQTIFATSSDPEELKYYWNTWREKNDKWAMKYFLTMVDSIIDTAKEMGQSAYEFWMKDYNMIEMDAAMSQIEPFYHQLHAFLRNKLNKKYGDSVIKIDGPIPEHLFQQVLAQTWTKGSVLDENFPYTDLPPYDEILKQNKFDAMKLLKTADKFYESMGFDAIPESYWGTRLKMKEEEDRGDCRAKIQVESPKIFMQYCQTMDFRKFLQAHGYMADIHYALEKSHLPAYYFDSYDLEHAVGEAVVLSASSPKHLSTVGIVTDFQFTEEVFMNRLMRLNLHSMLHIPVYYVHTKVMADLFAGKVEKTELNKHYWELMEKYVGVGPPGDRVSNTFDFPFKFYLEINKNLQARKFNSEILSYQIFMKLCSITGQYPKEHLQNCDFYGSKVAGDALKKMMKLGSSKPFHEVLASMLPENPKLNAESLLEYFFPANSWLSVSNQQNNVHIGWKHSDKKIDSVQLPEKDDD